MIGIANITLPAERIILGLRGCYGRDSDGNVEQTDYEIEDRAYLNVLSVAESSNLISFHWFQMWLDNEEE